VSIVRCDSKKAVKGLFGGSAVAFKLCRCKAVGGRYVAWFGVGLKAVDSPLGWGEAVRCGVGVPGAAPWATLAT